MSRKILVLGGARSGKSRYAERLAAGCRGPRLYIATAEAFDEETRDRIARHRAQRADGGWTTIEAPVALPQALAAADRDGAFVLIDCVTVWIGNLLHHGREVGSEVDRLASNVRAARATVAVVANETGLGIVPDNALARRFRDEAGLANQLLAEVADEVVFVAAGLALILKPAARPQPASPRRTASARGGKA